MIFEWHLTESLFFNQCYLHIKYQPEDTLLITNDETGLETFELWLFDEITSSKLISSMTLVTTGWTSLTVCTFAMPDNAIAGLGKIVLGATFVDIFPLVLTDLMIRLHNDTFSWNLV